MSSQAREVKSIKVEAGYLHREHRSRKNRKQLNFQHKVRDIKNKIQELRMQDAYDIYN